MPGTPEAPVLVKQNRHVTRGSSARDTGTRRGLRKLSGSEAAAPDSVSWIKPQFLSKTRPSTLIHEFCIFRAPVPFFCEARNSVSQQRRHWFPKKCFPCCSVQRSPKGPACSGQGGPCPTQPGKLLQVPRCARTDGPAMTFVPLFACVMFLPIIKCLLWVHAPKFHHIR